MNGWMTEINDLRFTMAFDDNAPLARRQDTGLFMLS